MTNRTPYPEFGPEDSDHGSFAWGVDVAGYDLAEPPPGYRSASEQFGVTRETVERRIVRRGGQPQEYCPPAELYREFARLPDDDAAFLEFTRQYGPLRINPLNDNAGDPWRAGESVDWLRGRRDHMRKVVEAVDDFLEFEKRLRDAGHRYNRRTRELPAVDPGEARQIVAGLFNQWIDVPLTAQLYPVTQKRKARVILRPTPPSLLAFMWLQIAQTIQSTDHVKFCTECHSEFEVGPGQAQRNRVTCSDACRKARSRRLAREARSED